MRQPEFNWRQEQWAVGEAQREVRPEPEVQTELQRSNAEILSDYSAERVAAQVRRRQSGVRERSWTRSGLAVGLLASACAVAFFTLRDRPAEQEDTRLKGGVALACSEDTAQRPHLHVYLFGSGASKAATEPVQARKGDRIQLGYFAGSAPQGVIVSLDGRGRVSLHFPLSLDSSPVLPGREASLPKAFELDDAPGFERFFFVTGEAVSPGAVLSAARVLALRPDKSVAPLALPTALWQSSFNVLKVDAEATP